MSDKTVELPNEGMLLRLIAEKGREQTAVEWVQKCPDTPQWAVEKQHARAMVELIEACGPVLEWLGPCDHIDHHGNCQTHAIERDCRVARLRAALAAVEGRDDA